MNELTNTNNPIRVLDLFSGIGGFALAAEIANAMADAEQQQDYGERRACVRGGMHEAAQRDNGKAGADCACGCGEDVADAMPTGSSSEWRSGGQQERSWKYRFAPLAHAEVEPFVCAVYHRHFPDSVCFGGVENVSRDSLFERTGFLPDVVCGGFPCQPHSCAGKRLASADERDLWGECRRILGDVRPRFALFENVGGLLTSESGLFFNRVLSDLAALRYACQWQVVPAAAVGAPHRRDRVWMLCWDELPNTPGERCREAGQHIERSEKRTCRNGAKLADGQHTGLQGSEITGRTRGERTKPNDEQPVRLCGASLSWPALAGHWPSRPGEPQHGWEPPRVVGNADQQGGRKCDGWRESPQPQHNDKRQTEPPLGVLPDGLPAAVGRDWPQVHNRVAQLKAAGNAIVPEVAAIFMHAILQVYQLKTTNSESHTNP